MSTVHSYRVVNRDIAAVYPAQQSDAVSGVALEGRQWRLDIAAELVHPGWSRLLGAAVIVAQDVSGTAAGGTRLASWGALAGRLAALLSGADQLPELLAYPVEGLPVAEADELTD